MPYGSFGVKGLWYNTRDSAGYFNIGASAGDQTGTGMTRARGAKSIATQVPDADRLFQGGDNETLFSKLVEPDNLPGGTLTMAVQDLSFEATCQGVTNDTIAAGTAGFIGTAPDTLADLVMVTHTEITDVSTGATKWLTLIMPKAQVKPNFGTLNTKQWTDFQYSATFDKVLKMPWGADASKAVPLRPIEADEPIMVHGWLGDAFETVFNLPYTPTANTDVSIWIDGTLQTITTNYTISSAAITFVAAPGSNAKIEAVYQVADTTLYS